jgi:YidC/Oxa1 family membrane protein insertase
MNESNRNMIIAIVLSVVVLLGWQFFVAGPQLQKQQQQAALEQQQASAANPGLATTASSTAPGSTATPAATGTPAAAPAIVDRAQAIAATQRVAIDTPSVKGSINLTGGRLDDLELKKYTETVDPTSPIITLLSPSGVETPQGMP